MTETKREMDPRLLTVSAVSSPELEQAEKSLASSIASLEEYQDWVEKLDLVVYELRCQELWSRCRGYMCALCKEQLATGAVPTTFNLRCDACKGDHKLVALDAPELRAVRSALNTLKAVGWFK